MNLYNNQQEMLYNVENYDKVLHLACRRSGKTIGAVNVIKTMLFKPKKVVVVFSSSINNYLFSEVIKLIPKSKIQYINHTAQQLLLHNNSLLDCRPTKNTERIKVSYSGFPDLTVFEDSIELLPKEVVDQFLYFSDKVLITTTPLKINIENTYSIDTIIGLAKKYYTNWAFNIYSWKDVEFWAKNPSHIEEVKKHLGEDLFNKEYNCK